MARAKSLVVSLLLLAAIVGPPLRAEELHVIQLHHRLADDLIPVLRPLVEPGGVLTGMDDKLLLRTSSDNLRQIEAAVAALDHAPRQLLITVGQGTVASGSAAQVAGTATVGSGDVQVGVNRPPTPGEPSGAQVTAGAVAQQANLHDLSSVRTLEGNETFIAVGRSAPVSTTTVVPGWHGPVVQQSTEYRDVSSGFYATPRLSGDRVILEISQRQQQLHDDARTGVVATQGATTTVAGRLGEWIPIGAVRESQDVRTTGMLVWGTRSDRSEYTAWVKVEEVP